MNEELVYADCRDEAKENKSIQKFTDYDNLVLLGKELRRKICHEVPRWISD